MKPISIDTEIVSKIALLWLVIPVAITIAFWFRPIFAIPTLVLIIASICKSLHNNQDATLVSGKNSIPLNWQVVTVLLFLLLWIALIGIGGFLGQEERDNSFRNAVMEELTDREWPVTCDDYQPFAYLNYYFTYWTIPAFIGKLLPSDNYIWAQGALYAYSYIGLACAVLMIMQLCRKRFLLTGVLLFLFGGGDIFNHILFRSILHLHHDNNFGTIYFEAGTLPYLCNYIYNQGIPLLVYLASFVRRNAPGKDLMMLSFLFAYAPFMTLPMIPVVLIIILKNFRKSLTIENITGLIVCLLFTVLYSGNSNGTSIGTLFMEEPASLVCLYFFCFIFFNYAIFIPFIWNECKNDWIFWVLFATTVFLCFLTPGYDNYDFGWKAPAPFTLYFLIKLLRKAAAMDWKIQNPKAWMLGFLFCIGTFSNTSITLGIKNRTSRNVKYLIGKTGSMSPRSTGLRHNLFNPSANDSYHNFVTDRPTIYSKYFMPRQHADERNPQ